jgi:hypothetical protein
MWKSVGSETKRRAKQSRGAHLSQGENEKANDELLNNESCFRGLSEREGEQLNVAEQIDFD